MKSRLFLQLGLAATVGAGVLLATEIENPTGPTTPGWIWGQANCNPANNATNDPKVCNLEDCYNCCTLGYHNNWMTQTELGQCKSFCDAVVWTNWECEYEE